MKVTGELPQSPLFDLATLINPDMEEGMTLQQRFEAFHAANPAIYDLLLRNALDLRRRGRKRYGVAALFEVMRWQVAMQTTGDEFKLNNNYKALYARLLMEQEPELEDFFEIRCRRSE